MTSSTTPLTTKRLILCCDGTWMNSDNGYEKGGILRSEGTLQVPSNVTRISRCFKRRCNDGRLQIINYESGVGTGSNTLDSITGGAFGLGLSERMREAYSYLCANYMDGDEIILVGFSRGAFTARSVAGMVANLGLLTREGIEHFYPIFSDMQHWNSPDYKDPFPDIPFANKPKGENAAVEYRSRLEKLGLTRVNQNCGAGELIKIKAVCVWDTWYDTNLSDRIEHAFHALALDEHRPPFSPAVWERLPSDKDTTDLRQVWFPGNHANCGGGWDDQGIANITLAWMMDQLASISVEFDTSALDRLFKQNVEYYEKAHAALKGKKPKGVLHQWAVNPIFEQNSPCRPWALSTIKKATGMMYKFAGQDTRSPGLYKPTDPKTKTDKDRFLVDTNERIHSSVRVRLACKGLGLDDKAVWDCPALLKNWTVKRTQEKYDDPVPFHPGWDPDVQEDDKGCPNDWVEGRWVWEYSGDEKTGPSDKRQRVMVEEPLGPYERYLLKLSGGDPNVYHFVAKQG